MAKGKGESPWQRLLQFVGAHMHEEVTDDRLDRALKTASGSLTRNPPFVEDQITVETGGTAEAGAISPTGTVAIVLAEYRGREGTAVAKRLRLLTRWSDGRRQIRDLGERSPRVSVAVVFPEGSDEPAVIVEGELVVWGEGELGLRTNGRPLRGMTCLTLSQEGDMRFGAWIEADGFACQFPFSVPGRAMGGTGGLRGKTRWLGLVGGTLARITVKDGGETLRWRNHELPVGGINPSTICFVKDGAERADVGSFMQDHLQFVAGDRAYYWTGGTPFDAKLPEGKLHVVGGRIFVATRLLDRDVRLMEFVAGQFKPVGDTNEGMGYCFDQSGQLLLSREGYVLTFANDNRPDTSASVQLGGVGGLSSDLANPEDRLVFTLHGYFCALRGADGRLNVDTVGNFPLYGVPYDRLAAVEDARGKSIMSWSFAEGTLHVLRYPLPSR